MKRKTNDIDRTSSYKRQRTNEGDEQRRTDTKWLESHGFTDIPVEEVLAAKTFVLQRAQDFFFSTSDDINAIVLEASYRTANSIRNDRAWWSDEYELAGAQLVQTYLDNKI